MNEDARGRGGAAEKSVRKGELFCRKYRGPLTGPSHWPSIINYTLYRAREPAHVAASRRVQPMRLFFVFSFFLILFSAAVIIYVAS